jgi:hypothetical protein
MSVSFTPQLFYPRVRNNSTHKTRDCVGYRGGVEVVPGIEPTSATPTLGTALTMLSWLLRALQHRKEIVSALELTLQDAPANWN